MGPRQPLPLALDTLTRACTHVVTDPDCPTAGDTVPGTAELNGAARMSNPTAHPEIPDPDERARLNADLLAHGIETGFYDERGRPAPWPDDIDDWRPAIHDEPITPEPGQGLHRAPATTTNPTTRRESREHMTNPKSSS